ncbi:LacI family DNA-binding transcriptional regulator [Actinoallomurus oryzae]|jgi:DNA-binding LacI/PurR family transcriptional regulator|uniref:LacI family DNA-binding transcriptional regulator n=1 Tax=Actinoallomurus oryzae TaxID=502180 RepID=A0ABP8PER2_9ACTN
MRRPTLEAVAARAGVSRATVSRVVNGAANVKPHLRTAVMRAVEELGYIPNSAARSLVTRRTDSIALVVSEPPSRVFSDDPFFSAVIRAVSQELEAADRQVILMLASSAAGHARVERYVAGGHVDGVILLSMHGAEPLPASLSRSRVPMVSHGRPVASLPVPYCDCDNRGGARAAVEHLISRGRRRIATISGPPDMTAAQDRLGGYREVMAAAGRRPIVATGDFTRESGATAMRRLLADEPEIDAVFAASDLMAVGALGTLRAAGRRVPDDVAVAGFDDIALAGFSEPPLTTVRQPVTEVAACIVRTLLSTDPPSAPVILPTELIVREST